MCKHISQNEVTTSLKIRVIALIILNFLQACTKKMSESCNQSKMESIKSGMLVAIKDKDTWQRAQVTQVQGTMFKVIMIDVGKERCLQLYEVRGEVFWSVRNLVGI